MRISKMTLSLLLILIAAFAVSADDKKKDAVDDGKYTVSAKAGIVSIITGNVTFKRGNDNWQTLIEGDELKSKDVIKTSSMGRVEVLLNPGTYLRIAENSEVAFSDLSSFRLKVSLLSGSAILEAGVVDISIKMTTPQYVFTVARTGVYRFNVDASGRSEMLLRKGKMSIAGVEIKDGKKVVVDNAPPSILAFDKKAEDSFDTWSKDRAKTIIAANKKLSESRMRSSLLRNSFSSSYWIYDPWMRGYTFLPGWNNFSSPYGGSYSHCHPNANSWAGRRNGNGSGWSGGGSNSGGSSGGYTGGGRSSGGSTSGGSTVGSGGGTGGRVSGGMPSMGHRSEAPNVQPAPRVSGGGKIRDN